MDNKLYVVKPDEFGGALLGTITPRNFNTAAPKQVEKEPGQKAPLHNPTRPVLLTVRRGFHRIFTSSENGAPPDWEVRLTTDDRILFCDITGNGHGSEAGTTGALLETAEVLEEVDLDKLGWKEECFPE